MPPSSAWPMRDNPLFPPHPEAGRPPAAGLCLFFASLFPSSKQVLELREFPA